MKSMRCYLIAFFCAGLFLSPWPSGAQTSSENGNKHSKTLEELSDKASEEAFFVENVTFVEPFLSANSDLKPIELSRKLNEAELFTGMHEIVKGEFWIIKISYFGTTGGVHGGWHKDITLLFLKPFDKAQKEKVFKASEILGFYSASGGFRWFEYAIAEKGTAQITRIDKENLKVELNMAFKRIDVDRKAQETQDEESALFNMGPVNDIPIEHPRLIIHEIFTAKKLLFKQLDSSQRGWMTKEEEAEYEDWIDKEIFKDKSNGVRKP